MTMEIDSAALHEMPPFADSVLRASLLAESHNLFAASGDDIAAPLGEGFYDSLEDLLTADLDQVPEVIAGLQAGEVGVLFADARLSPGRLLTQLGLSLAAGDSSAPLLTNNLAPRRVLHLNTQWRLSYWRQLLEAGMTQLSEAAPAHANFMPMVAARLDEPVVNLAAEGQAQRLLAFLKHQRADFVLIDDIEALSGEAVEMCSPRHIRTLLHRLKQVARQANCVILLTETIRRGDGGGGRRATLAALADTVYRVEADKREASRAVILHCEKSRGALPPALLLQYDDENSWFTVSDEAPPVAQLPPTLDELIAFVEENKGAHTAEIVQHFANRASPRKIAYLLKDAEMRQRLVKDRHKSAWQVCNYQDLLQPTDEFAYQTLADIPQITLLDLNTIPNAPFESRVKTERLQKPVQKRKKHSRKNRRR